MSPELKQFYQDLQRRIDDGLPAHKIFYRQSAICSNLCDYSISSSIVYENADLFDLAGLSRMYPFNAGNEQDFYDEETKNSFYKNPYRLAWIKKHASEGEE